MEQHQSSKNAWIIGGGTAIGIIGLLAGMHAIDPSTPDTPVLPNPKQAGASASGVTREAFDALRAKIDPYAVLLMTQEDYPNTYRRIGAAKFTTANALTPWAALAAAERDGCSGVDLVGVSEMSHEGMVFWYVECSGGKRIHVVEWQAEEMKAKWSSVAGGPLPEAIGTREGGLASAPEREKEKAEPVREQARVAPSNFVAGAFSNEGAVVAKCDLLTQKAMLAPGTFSTGWNKWEMGRGTKPGTVVIERDFTSENTYGMELNMRYHCILDANNARIIGLRVKQPNGWQKVL